MENVVKHELIGKTATINGTTGKIIDETKNTITLMTENKKKTYLKNNITITTTHKGKKIKINGKVLTKQPQERLKTKIIK
jgi:RNase P/RNase MRP subunit p29